MIKIRLVDKNNDNPEINWRGVATAYASIVSVMAFACLVIGVLFEMAFGYSCFTLYGWTMLGIALLILSSFMLSVSVRTALAAPPEKKQ
jgi:hypothetical protein